MTCPRVIVNPTAGRGRGARVHDEIETVFRQHQQRTGTHADHPARRRHTLGL